MFNIWKKKQPKLTSAQLEAFNFGQETVQAMLNRIDQVLSLSFAPVASNFVDVLRTLIIKCHDSTAELPPVLAIRAQYSFFIENVEQLGDNVLQENWLRA